MDSNIKTFLGKVIKILGKECKPQQIILFGSYAYGKPTRDSDIDLLVITEKHQDIRERYKLKCRLFKDFSMPIQVVVITPKEFIETKDVVGGIAYPASKYGEVLYEKSRTGNLGFRSTMA